MSLALVISLCHLHLFFGRILYFIIIFEEVSLGIVIPKISHVKEMCLLHWHLKNNLVNYNICWIFPITQNFAGVDTLFSETPSFIQKCEAHLNDPILSHFLFSLETWRTLNTYLLILAEEKSTSIIFNNKTEVIPLNSGTCWQCLLYT